MDLDFGAYLGMILSLHCLFGLSNSVEFSSHSTGVLAPWDVEEVKPYRSHISAASSSSGVQSVITNTLPYCSFFENRSPKPQPNLSNCTWYRKHSCCMETELKITFAKLKPLQGASRACVKHLNILMCYICAPNQHLFYRAETLYVCTEFCDAWYNACQDAILKGSVIRNLYKNGTEFCTSRRFQVQPKVKVNRNCFNYKLSASFFSDSAVTCYQLYFLLFTLLSSVCVVSQV